MAQDPSTQEDTQADTEPDTKAGTPPVIDRDGPDLRSRSSSGTLWTAVSLIAGKGIIALSLVVLGRLLDANVFGLFGIGMLVVGYLELFNNFGISSAVINLTGKDERLASVAFWVNIVLGTMMTVVTWLAAPLVAGFFDETRATSVIRALGFVFLFRSIGSVHDALLKRDLEMKAVTIAETVTAVSKGSLTIALAVLGLGVWSLVWGHLAGALLGSVVFWRVNPWRPQRLGSVEDPVTGSRRLLGFGSQMTLIDILGAINMNVDYLLIGRAIGTTALGVYTMAFRLPELLIDGINLVVAKVAFPLFSQLQDDKEKGKIVLGRMLALTSAIAVPAGVGLAIVADPLVRIVLGEKWTQVSIGTDVISTVPPLRWLALSLTATALTKNIGDLYKGYGKPGLLNLIGLARVLFVVPLLIVAVRYGISGVAVAHAGAATVVSIAQILIASRVVDIRLGDLLRSYRSPVIAGFTMTVITVPVIGVVDAWNPFVQLVVLTAVGAVSYVVTILAIDRRLVDEGLAFVRAGVSTEPG